MPPQVSTESQVGLDLKSMEDVEQEEVHKCVTEHMDSLAKDEDEKKGVPGFLMKPIWVRVEGPKVPCIVIVDLPGIKKPNADKETFVKACNDRILDWLGRSDPQTKTDVCCAQFLIQ